MKYAAVALFLLALTGCKNLTYEEFKFKTDWCIERGLTPVSHYVVKRDGTLSTEVYDVRCKDKDGNMFRTPNSK